MRYMRYMRCMQVVSGHRFVQISEDLSTLRWSWNDVILMHEISSTPTMRSSTATADEEERLIEVLHGPVSWRHRLSCRGGWGGGVRE